MEDPKDWQIGKQLKDRIYYMLQNEIMCDVTFLIGCDEQPIHAHKFMLASASPVFYCMFNGPMAETGDVKIPDIEPISFHYILKFIYTDVVDIDFTNIGDLMYGAEKYMLMTIKELCYKYLTSQISEDHACRVLQISLDLHLEDVKTNALKYLLDNGISCFQSKNVSSLNADGLKLLIGSDDFHCSEDDVFAITVEWGRNRCLSKELPIIDENIRNELGDLLYMIRFSKMEKKYFTEHVSKLDLLTGDEKIQVYQSFDEPSSSTFPSNPRCVREIFVRQMFNEGRKNSSRLDQSEDCLEFEMTRNCRITGIDLYGLDNSQGQRTIELKLFQNLMVLNFATASIDPGETLSSIRFKTPSKICANAKYKLQLYILKPFQEVQYPFPCYYIDKGCSIRRPSISNCQKPFRGGILSILFEA